MIFISHRGNLSGKNKKYENNIYYIKDALASKYNVETDIRLIDGKFWLGHNEPQYLFDPLQDLPISRIFYHCKNKEALEWFTGYSGSSKFKYFWHKNDSYVFVKNITYIWTHPKAELTRNSICVLPEVSKVDLDSLFKLASGICSDNIEYYKKEYDLLQNG